MDFDSLRGVIEMNRNDWEFEYSAGVLANAALEKKAYRQSRVDWWETEKTKLLEEIKACGIEITESVAASYSSNAGIGPQVGIKPELKTKLSECHTRIQKHMAAVREYDGWSQVLQHNGMATLKLKHNDWLFFFGRD